MDIVSESAPGAYGMHMGIARFLTLGAGLSAAALALTAGVAASGGALASPAPSPGICESVEGMSGSQRGQGLEHLGESHEFFFTRAVYSERESGFGYFGRGGRSWATDYPTADRTFTTFIKRLTAIDVCEWEHPVSLADPELRRFPWIYAVEVGRGGWSLTDEELEGLRGFLAAGGFMVIDDFWGSREWANFEREMHRILPGREIVEIPMDHPIFNMLYAIDHIEQVPNVGNAHEIAMGYPGATTSEQDGIVPHVRGIFDDEGRLMVVINWNTDLGDSWEWADDPYYPLRFSTYAYQLAANMIVYSMTH